MNKRYKKNNKYNKYNKSIKSNKNISDDNDNDNKYNKYKKRNNYNTIVKSLAYDKEVFVKFKIINVGFKMTQGTSIPTYVAYRLNSLYDPYYATGGSQPTGYDQ